MILYALLLAAPGPAAPPAAAEKRYAECTDAIAHEADHGIAKAEAWRRAGGDLPAAQCLGLAYVAAERWAPAAVIFTDAAREAELRRDGRAANLWVMAGNAALAGGDPAKARQAFDRALALPTMADPFRGEAHLDRARAAVAANEPAAARADIDAALKLVPGDPMAWLLSATLARRMGDAGRAKADIGKAAAMAPAEAPVLYEQGNVAALAGDAAAARSFWAKARDAAPASTAGRAAEQALAAEAPK